ncbi:MAG: 2-dehydropantoate 2-reductase [Blautia sp.]|nr:2-dehydropantoate 2-reductase [Blautia sp.]
MNYVIIGAGGTGGTLGAYLTKGGADVTLIARGKHLEALKAHGLKMKEKWKNEEEIIPVKALSQEEYREKADVVFVCVKGYSLDSVIPLIRQVSHKDSIVLPILNIYGTGGYLQEKIPELLVLDGCIYVSAAMEEPGTILRHGEVCKVVFGTRSPREYTPELKEIEKELCACKIEGILSDNIRRDALQKFSYVSPAGAAGLYFNAVAGDFQQEGEKRDFFASLIREIVALAEGMDIHFQCDLVQRNLQIMGELLPESDTSMQRDVKAGRPSEMDGLIFEVVRLGKKYQVPLPCYEKVAEKMHRMGY